MRISCRSIHPRGPNRLYTLGFRNLRIDGRIVRLRHGVDDDVTYTALLDYFRRVDLARYYELSMTLSTQISTGRLEGQLQSLLSASMSIRAPVTPHERMSGLYGVYQRHGLSVYMTCPGCAKIHLLDGEQHYFFTIYKGGARANVEPCFICTGCRYHFWPIFMEWDKAEIEDKGVFA